MTLKEERVLFKQAQDIARRFIGKNGVTDVEFGLKHSEGNLTDIISLRFRVNRKRAAKELKPSELIPKKVGKFKTDVLGSQCSQQVRVENGKNVVRPLIGGVQIQSGIYVNTGSYWGTLGCIQRIGDYFFGLTNYHVLYGGAKPEIVHDNYVDKLRVFQNLNRVKNQIGVAANFFSYDLDYATFLLQVAHDPTQSINALSGSLTSFAYPQINMPVVKSGAATGITYGVIDGRSCLECSELSIHIDPRYSNPNNPISTYGDSGSVWIMNSSTASPTPVALHYAGGEGPQWAKAKSFASILASIRNKTQTQNTPV